MHGWQLGCGDFCFASLQPPDGTPIQVNPFSLLPGKSLRGVIQGDAMAHSFIPMLIGHHLDGRFHYDRFLHFYENGLQDLNQAVADVCNPAGTVVKPVLVL